MLASHPDKKLKKTKTTCLFFPSDKFSIFWDFMISFVVIYLFFILGFEVSFLEKRFLFFYILEYFISIIFIFDIFYIFNKAYVDKKDKLVISRKKIAVNYLKSWFIVDLLAAFPLIVFERPDGSLNTNIFGDINSFKLLTLLKLLKLIKIIAIVFNLSNNSNSLRNYSAQLKHKKRQLILNITFVILYCHIFTCIFYTIPFYYSDVNWVRGRELENKSILEKYLFSLHFTIETVITVGYGENPLEYFYFFV